MQRSYLAPFRPDARPQPHGTPGERPDRRRRGVSGSVSRPETLPARRETVETPRRGGVHNPAMVEPSLAVALFPTPIVVLVRVVTRSCTTDAAALLTATGRLPGAVVVTVVGAALGLEPSSAPLDVSTPRRASAPSIAEAAATPSMVRVERDRSDRVAACDGGSSDG